MKNKNISIRTCSTVGVLTGFEVCIRVQAKHEHLFTKNTLVHIVNLNTGELRIIRNANREYLRIYGQRALGVPLAQYLFNIKFRKLDIRVGETSWDFSNPKLNKYANTKRPVLIYTKSVKESTLIYEQECRDINKQKQMAGIKKAKEEGKYKGRKADEEKYAEICNLIFSGNTITKVSKVLKCCRPTIYKALVWEKEQLSNLSKDADVDIDETPSNITFSKYIDIDETPSNTTFSKDVDVYKTLSYITFSKDEAIKYATSTLDLPKFKVIHGVCFSLFELRDMLTEVPE